LDAVKNVEHPKGIEKQQQGHDRRIDRLCVHVALKERRSRGSLEIGIDDMEHIYEPEQENNEQDNLKKHEIKMTHQPFSRQIIPMPNFDHKIFKCHQQPPKGILTNSFLKAIIISDF